MEDILGLGYLKALSRNAAKLSRAARKEGTTAVSIAMAAAATIHGDAKEALMLALDTAIASSKEYNIPEFTGPLHRCFNAADIITYSRTSAHINAKKYAGGWEDLRAGIDAARSDLGVGGQLSLLDASRFWKWRIYKPARESKVPKTFSVYKYKTKLSREKTKERKENQTEKLLAYGKEKYKLTIAARKKAWGLAPYWLLIENGNMESNKTGGNPYPIIEPQRFIYLARQVINELYRDAIVTEADKYARGLNDDVLAFLYDPSSQEPGTSLGELKARGSVMVRLFVTPTGLLGYETLED